MCTHAYASGVSKFCTIHSYVGGFLVWSATVMTGVSWKAEGSLMVSPEAVLPSGREGVVYLILLGFLLSKEE